MGKVKVGQIWVDALLPKGSRLKVTAVDGKHAECEVVGKGRTMRIQTARLLSGEAGYVRWKKPKPEDTERGASAQHGTEAT